MSSRNYNKLYVHTDREEGSEKLLLGYQNDTRETVLSKDTETLFHVPFNAKTQKLVDSSLILDGATAGLFPAASDRIFKNNKNYGDSTPNGSTTDNANGLWFCSWLYKDESGNVKWMDRYYNPGTFTSALAISQLTEGLVYRKSESVYRDVESTMTLEPGVQYRYFHVGENTAKKLVTTFGGVSGERLKLNLENWGSDVVDTSSGARKVIVNTNGPTTDLYKPLIEPNRASAPVFRFDNPYSTEAYVDYDSDYNPTEEFTLAFWAYSSDWNNAQTTQLVGNFCSNGGYGVFIRNLDNYPFFVIPETNYGHVLYVNSGYIPFLDISLQTTESVLTATPQFVAIDSDNHVITCNGDGSGTIIKYDNTKKILFATPITNEKNLTMFSTLSTTKATLQPNISGTQVPPNANYLIVTYKYLSSAGLNLSFYNRIISPYLDYLLVGIPDIVSSGGLGIVPDIDGPYPGTKLSPFNSGGRHNELNYNGSNDNVMTPDSTLKFLVELDRLPINARVSIRQDLWWSGNNYYDAHYGAGSHFGDGKVDVSVEVYKGSVNPLYNHDTYTEYPIEWNIAPDGARPYYWSQNREWRNDYNPQGNTLVASLSAQTYTVTAGRLHGNGRPLHGDYIGTIVFDKKTNFVGWNNGDSTVVDPEAHELPPLITVPTVVTMTEVIPDTNAEHVIQLICGPNNSIVVTTSKSRYTYDTNLVLLEAIPWNSTPLTVAAYSYDSKLGTSNLVITDNVYDSKFIEMDHWCLSATMAKHTNGNLYVKRADDNHYTRFAIVSATNFSIDPYDRIWVLHDTNKVSVYDPSSSPMSDPLFEFEAGSNDNHNRKNINFLSVYDRVTDSREWRCIIYYDDGPETKLFIFDMKGYLLENIEAVSLFDAKTFTLFKQEEQNIKFSGKGDFTGYEHSRVFSKLPPYNNNSQLSIRASLKDKSKSDLTFSQFEKSIPINNWNTKSWRHFVLTLKNRIFTLYVDGINMIELPYSGQYDLSYELQPALFIGSPGGSEIGFNREIGSRATDIFNGIFQDIKIYDYALNEVNLEMFSRSLVPAQDLHWSIVTPVIQYIETIERMFKNKIPGAKSNFFNIKLCGAQIKDDQTRKIIEQEIRVIVSKTKPAYADFLNIRWIE